MIKIAKVILVGLGVLFLSASAFEVYFADSAGNKLGKVQEGTYVYIVIKDPEKGACGISEFRVDLLLFDFKTGAYIEAKDAVFRELGGIGSGIYFWVTGPGSNQKVAVPIGSRADFATLPYGQTHVLGNLGGGFQWREGAWEYIPY
jgi:hypothetical protein